MNLDLISPLTMDNMVLLLDSHQAVVKMHLDQASLLALGSMGLDQVSLLAMANIGQD